MRNAIVVGSPQGLAAGRQVELQRQLASAALDAESQRLPVELKAHPADHLAGMVHRLAVDAEDAIAHAQAGLGGC